MGTCNSGPTFDFRLDAHTEVKKQRPNVTRFLPHWQQFLALNGPDMTRDYLDKGKYRLINRKDAMAIKKELGL